MYVCVRLPACLTVSSRRMLMRDRWPRKSQHCPHWTPSSCKYTLEFTKGWPEHDTNTTRQDRVATFTQNERRTAAFRPLQSGRLVVPARVDADGGLVSLCELHPRVAHYRPTDARIPKIPRETCARRAVLVLFKSALIPRVHLSFFASLFCILRRLFLCI